MERLITLTFSIHYVTVFGEEIQVMFDNSTVKKLTWNTNHLWTGTISTIPRATRWWYSVIKNGEVVRVEDLEIPREYDFDCKDKYFQIVDHWNDYFTNVTPVTIKKYVVSKSMASNLIGRYLIPRYQASLERRKTPPETLREQPPSTSYLGVEWGYLDDLVLAQTSVKRLTTVYSIIHENLLEK
ncbi:Uncharacterized protein QTN25_007708 [Entamoeba marina]